MLNDSFNYLYTKNKEAIYDAEHFFDGFKHNKDYAIKCLSTALNCEARWIVLCDTNGGTLPKEISEIIEEVKKTIPSEKLGIRRIIGTLIGICGVTLVTGFDVLKEITLTSLSQLAVLLASISYALGSVWGQTQLFVYEPKDIACGTLLIGSLISVPFVILTNGIPNLAAFDLKFILILFGLSIAGTAVAYIVYFRILELAGAANLMLVTIIVPVFAILIDVILLQKWISLQIFLGFLKYLQILLINNFFYLA